MGIGVAFAEENFELPPFFPCLLPLPLPLLEGSPCGLGEGDCEANVGADDELPFFPFLLPLSLLEGTPCGRGEGDCDSSVGEGDWDEKGGVGDKLLPPFEDGLLLVLRPLFPLPALPET